MPIASSSALGRPPPGAGVYLSRWTMPLLRVGMGLFLAAWGLDKLFAVEGSQRIFERFYQVDAGPSLIQLAGGAEWHDRKVAVAEEREQGRRHRHDRCLTRHSPY